MTDRLIAARNSVLFGLTAQERKNGNYQNHSLIRNDWKSVDKLRDAIAYVPVIATHEDGSRHVYDRARDQYLTCRVPFHGGSHMTGLQDTTPTAFVDASFGVVHSGSTDQVLFAKSSWNRAKTSANATTDAGQPMAGNVRSLLYKENEGTDIEGVPYFSKYYHQDPAETEGPIGMQPSEVRMAGSTEAVTPIMNAQLANDEYIYDHYFQYQTYDKTESEVYNITITPHYNFYLDSSPDYETAISSIPEPMIPNYYMLEIAFATGSAATPSAYKNALSLDFAMDQIETIIDKEGSLETVEGEQQVQALSQGYFQYYVSSLGSFASSSTPAYNNKYKNIAVLSEDLAGNVLEEYNQITRDDRNTVSTQDDFPAIGNYPFYNHVNIPWENNFNGGNINDARTSMLTALWADQEDEIPFFLTLLQLLAIDIYNGTNTLSPTSLSFNTYDKIEGTLQSENTSTDLFFNLEEVMSLVRQYASNPGDPPELAASFVGRLEILAELYMGEVQPDDTVLPNVVFIQSDGVREGEHGVDGFVNSVFQLTGFAQALLTRFEEWTRTFYDIFTGTARPAASEEFMYVVEKRVIPPGATAANPTDAPVQTLFFGKDIKTDRGINYYDTQIKYGVRYQYDIKQVRLVVGNRYKYTKAFTIANSGSLHEGRAIGNALGFYAPEDMAVTNTVSFQQRQAQTGWTYIPEGGTTENHLSEQVGYFIYKFGFGSRVSQMFDAAAPYIGLYGTIDPETQPWWTVHFAHGAQEREDLFTWLPLRAQVGDGFDGNKSGGFVGGAAVEYQKSDDLVGASMVGGNTEEAGGANYTTVSGFVTSATVNEAGFFTNTAHDVEDEPSLIDLIAEIFHLQVGITATEVAEILNADFSEWRSKIIAIIRETVGPDAAMAAQVWILSFPSGSPSAQAQVGSWTRGNVLTRLAQLIAQAVMQMPGNSMNNGIGNFASKLEDEFESSGAFNDFAASLNVHFRNIYGSGS